MESVGVTCCEPLAWTAPMPSMDMSVALVVCQERVVDWPRWMLFGFAVSDAVGCGAGGGAGGGGGGFFLQPASTIKIANAATIVSHFILLCFTSILPARKLASHSSGASAIRMESSRNPEAL